jgi:PST family polysaccharide transporter
MVISGKLIQAVRQRMFGSAARNFSLLTVEQIIRSILGVLVGAWVLRYLGPEKSGSITYIVASIAILGAVAKLGFDPIVLRDVNLKPEQRGVLLGTAFSLEAAACVLIFCIWMCVAIISYQTRLDFLLSLVLSLMLLAQPFDVFKLWFQGTGQIEKPVLVRVTALIILSVLRVCAILSGLGILVFSALLTAEEWLAGALNYMFFRHGRAFKLQVRREYAGILLRESWPYLLSGLAVTMYMRIDQVMLGTMLDKRAVGIFYAAVALCGALQFLPAAINISVFPILTRLRRENEARYERIMMLYCNLTLVYSILITLMVWFLAPFVIALLYGPHYAESTEVLRIYILSFCFVCLGTAQCAWFINNQRGDIVLKKCIAGLIANVSLNLILIPRYGPNGAAWSTVAGQFVSVVATNFFFDRRFALMRMRSMAEGLFFLLRV